MRFIEYLAPVLRQLHCSSPVRTGCSPHGMRCRQESDDRHAGGMQPFGLIRLRQMQERR